MIISEFCQNHNGNMGLLHEMVVKSAEAGAQFAKIQSFFAEDLNLEWHHDFERLKRTELNWEQQAQFVKWCREYNLIPMTSVYSFKYADKLHESGFEWIKIGSAQSNREMLIRNYKMLGFKVIQSTGGRELKKCTRVGPIEGVLHCVSKYPHDPLESNLSRMLEIKKYWHNTPYGFSDHSNPADVRWDAPSKIAMSLGASFIERHFTLLSRHETKDGPVSVNFEQLKELCRWDKLAFSEKLSERPEIGLIVCPQMGSEIELIRKYEGRWNEAISSDGPLLGDS